MIERTVVILQGAGHDFGGRSGVAVYQHDDGIVPALVPVLGVIRLFRRSAAAMGDNCLAFVEEVVSDRNSLIQKAAWIFPEVEHQALYIVLAEPA